MRKAFLIGWLMIGSGTISFAGTSTWTGAIDSDFNNAGNWLNGVPTDVAALGDSPQTSLTMTGNVTLNELQLNASTSDYALLNSGNILSISGAGITNTSTNTLHVTNAGVMLFNNSSTSGAIAIDLNKSAGLGTLIFNNTANAGNTLIKPQDGPGNSGAIVQFNNSSNAGSAIFSTARSTLEPLVTLSRNVLTIQFNDSSNAAHATITGLSAFTGLSSANQAIFNGSAASFQGNSTADRSTFNNSGGSIVAFMDSATAGHASLTNSTGGNFVEFSNSATAGTALISNTLGHVSFFNSATGSNSLITNSGAGLDSTDNICVFGPFAPTANVAGGVHIGPPTIANVIFCALSSAGNATITNTNSAVTQFNETSSAGNAILSNFTASSITFHDVSSAGSATLTNNDVNTSVNFFQTATAGNSTITNAGTGNLVQFNNSSTAGNAVISNNGGGLIQFNDTSTGGNAAIDNSSGTIRFSNLSSSGLTVGSIAGAGSIVLGAKSLTLGGNGLSTDISGVISGTGGSLVKVGTGTLSLSGTNTYSGGTQINGGALGIVNDSSLGDTSGALTINNGTLLTSADLAFGRAITMNGGAIDTQGFHSTLSGTIDGAGALVKTGDGTLTLTGANTYQGATLVGGGVLQAGAANTLPSQTAVVLVNAPGVGLDLNGFNQTIGSLSGGGSSGGDVALGTATLTAGSNNASTLFAGSIAGSGSLVKVGTGTLVLSGANTYTGDTTVQSGGLEVIAAPPLPGSGSPSDVVSLQKLVNNGTVTPGSGGVGVLKVSSYTGPGALTISFNGASHTLLSVAGNADLTGGTLHLTGSNFVTGRYSVIQAGSLTGAFAALTTPPPSFFLTFSTDYTPTDVQVLINALRFKDVAHTGNQQGVAGALDAAAPGATGDFAAALGAIQALSSASDIQNAYAQLSGDSLASFQNTGLRGAAQFSQLMHERSAASGFTMASLPAAPVQVAYAGDIRDLGPLSPPAGPSSGLWSRGVGFFDKSDADEALGSPGAHAATGGFQAGYDFDCAREVLCGFSAGYAKTNLTVDDRSSAGHATSVQSGLYAGYQPGAWFFNGSFAYTSASNDMTRAIVFPGVNESAHASFQSRLYTSVLEAGYLFKPRKVFTLEPSVALRQSHLEQDGFTESGAPGLDLTVGDQKTDSLVSVMGVRLSRPFLPKTAHPFTLGVRSAWEHELRGINQSLTAQFAQDSGGNTFAVQGTPRGRNAAVVGVDGRMDLSRSVQAFATYAATLSAGQNSEAIQGGLSLRW